MCCCIPQAGTRSEHSSLPVSHLRTLAALLDKKRIFRVRADKLRPALLTAYQLKFMSPRKKKDSYVSGLPWSTLCRNLTVSIFSAAASLNEAVSLHYSQNTCMYQVSYVPHDCIILHRRHIYRRKLKDGRIINSFTDKMFPCYICDCEKVRHSERMKQLSLSDMCSPQKHNGSLTDIFHNRAMVSCAQSSLTGVDRLKKKGKKKEICLVSRGEYNNCKC